jgi:hypothetical protein
MASKRIGPEAKIISLFTALSDDSKRIVLDVIKSQTAKPRASSPKSIAPAAEKKSSRKAGAGPSTVSTEDVKESVSTASAPQTRFVPICVICGNMEGHADHQPDSPSYHIFRTSLKSKDKKSNGVVLPDVPEEFVHEATA